jgi:beta-mannosidase
MRPLALLVLLLLTPQAQAESHALDGNWVWRKAPAPGEETTAPAEWRRLSPGNRQAEAFSLARQLAEDTGQPLVRPGGFEAEDTVELGIVFRVPPSLAANTELTFDRIDTFAEIYLDGELLLETDNAFVTHRVRLPRREGERQLLIRLSPTRPEARRRESLLTRASVGGERVVARRPQLGFGGPVAPPTLDLGFAYPRLSSWEGAVVRDDAILAAATPRISRGPSGTTCTQADLRLELLVEAETAAEATLALTCREATASTQATLRPGLNTLSLPFSLKEPPLWWTRGLGAQEMPSAEWELRVGDRVTKGVRAFGIRDLRLIRAPDERGESFRFELNGVPLVIRGAHLLPSHALHPERADLAALALGVEAGLNLVRVWAGGTYAPRELMDRCDQLGVLVWQDLPFLEAPYPLEDVALQAVLTEVRQQVRRLRSHPSLAIWCGVTGAAEGREEGAWDAALASPRAIAEERARQAGIFRRTLPSAIAELDPRGIYLPESPRLGWRHESAYRIGDLWYRGLELGLDSAETAQGRVGRFVSGHGAGSHPSPAVRRAWPAKVRGGESDPESHLPQADRLPVILAQRMGEEGLRPEDGETRAFASRWLQAEAVRNLTSAHRADPACGGSLLWHLNDCWPSSTASVIDFTGAPKPAYFALRQALAPETVRLWFEGDTVSASPLGGGGGTLLRLLDAGGRVVRESRAEGAATARLAGLRPGEASYALAECGPHRLIRPLSPAYRGASPLLGRASFQVEARRDPASALGFAELTVTAETVVIGLCLEPLLPGARAMDGLVDLLPGERHVLQVRLAEPRDWRASFRAVSWHDLGVVPAPLRPDPPAR